MTHPLNRDYLYYNTRRVEAPREPSLREIVFTDDAPNSVVYAVTGMAIGFVGFSAWTLTGFAVLLAPKSALVVKVGTVLGFL